MSQLQHWSTALSIYVLLAITALFLGSTRLLVAQEVTQPAPTTTPPTTTIPTETAPLDSAPPLAERLLTPIPERFQWLQRDVRSNPLLAPLARLFPGSQERRNQLLLTVSLSEEYSDNFFREQEARSEEYTTRAILNTLYRFDEGPAFVSLANSLSAAYRAKSEENHVGFVNLSLNAGYTLPRLSFGLTESFVRDDETSDEGGETASRAISRRRGVFLRNQVSPQVQYALGPLTTVRTSYTNIIVKGEEEAADDANSSSLTTDSDNSISHAFSAGLRHTFSPSLTASMYYTFTQTDSETSEDSRTNDAQMQMAYRFSSATSATLQAFGRMIDRSNGGIDSQSYGLLLGMRQVLTPNVAVSVAVGPAFVDQDDRKKRVFLNWQANIDGAIPIFRNRNTVLTLSTDQAVEDTSTDVDDVGLVLRQTVSMQLNHTVSSRLQASLYANYTRTEPLERVESTNTQQIGTENFWSAGARATYLLTRVISVTAAYRYQRRDSSQEMENFDENRVTISLSGNLPIF